MSIENIQAAVRGFYSRKDPGHDFSHALRVRDTALYIAAREGGNREIIELAALMHDIGRESPLEKTHASSSASLAVTILEKYGYSETVISAVRHCIAVHSLETGEPESIEAKIVFDADKLDFTGAIGLARLFMVCGAETRPVYSGQGQAGMSAEEIFTNKIRHFPAKLYTRTARELLADNDKFALEFWRRLRRQVNLSDLTNT